ncbi:MAG: hypothetical protein E7K89_10175, partial [Anaerococcus vaginalis]|nr:hypothetical protein [Anaerococcus vaginalis]
FGLAGIAAAGMGGAAAVGAKGFKRLADIEDAQAYETHHGKTADSVGDVYLVYSMCVAPDLHDQELQEAYGTKGPGIVNALLRPGEVQELTEALMEKAGYVDKSVVEIEKAEEVKN